MKKNAVLLVLCLVCCFPLEGKLTFRGPFILPLPAGFRYEPVEYVFDGTGGKQYLYALNENREVEVFNLRDKTSETLKLDPEPDFRINGVGIQGTRVFLYNRLNATVYFYENGHLVNQYPVGQDEYIQGRRMVAFPYVQTLSPMKAFGETLIMTGPQFNESMRSPDIPEMVLCLLDLKSGKVVNVVEMPEVYAKYNWGGGFAYRMPYFDLGPDGEVICCFAATDELAAYSLKTGRARRVKAPSRHIGQIAPYSKTDRNSPAGVAQWEWYRNNPSYDGILYDPWREVYYRFALLPERPDRKGTNDYPRKPISVIVLDKNLRPMEETLLDGRVSFRPYESFVSPEGLFIKVVAGKDDRFLTFYQFQYEQGV